MSEEEIVVTFDDENGLTQFQKAVIKKIYKLSNSTIKEVVDTPEIADALVVTIAIGNLVKLIENININNKPLSGKNKKEIVLYLGRLLLNDLLPEKNKSNILGMYDLLAEPTLEKLIDVSKNIKVIARDKIEDVVENVTSNNSSISKLFRCFC
tara:strand:- start:246 stop:704 length:459 start_codon:yes stop_codon:yes gene_type:complete